MSSNIGSSRETYNSREESRSAGSLDKLAKLVAKKEQLEKDLAQTDREIATETEKLRSNPNLAKMLKLLGINEQQQGGASRVTQRGGRD